MLWVILSHLYLFIGVWFGLTVDMVLTPPDSELLGHPHRPAWFGMVFTPESKLVLVVLSGLGWPLTLLVFIGWWIYSKVKGT